MTRALVILAAAGYLGMDTPPAYAHHSHPYFYDQCRTVTIEGRVEQIDWKNPHTIIVVTQDDGATFTIDWNGLAALRRDGVLGPATEALVVGARVAITGNPIRTAAQIRSHFPDFTSNVNPRTIDPESIRRADAAWSWAMRRNPNAKPPDCNAN